MHQEIASALGIPPEEKDRAFTKEDGENLLKKHPSKWSPISNTVFVDMLESLGLSDARFKTIINIRAACVKRAAARKEIEERVADLTSAILEDEFDLEEEMKKKMGPDGKEFQAGYKPRSARMALIEGRIERNKEKCETLSLFLYESFSIPHGFVEASHGRAYHRCLASRQAGMPWELLETTCYAMGPTIGYQGQFFCLCPDTQASDVLIFDRSTSEGEEDEEEEDEEEKRGQTQISTA